MSAPDPDELCDVTVAAADGEWLARFTSALVAERLAACGNVIPSIRSIYRWEGAIEERSEALVILHTRRSLVPRILDRVAREHADTTPQVLVLPVLEAHPGYRDWVLASTAADPRPSS